MATPSRSRWTRCLAPVKDTGRWAGGCCQCIAPWTAGRRCLDEGPSTSEGRWDLEAVVARWWPRRTRDCHGRDEPLHATTMRAITRPMEANHEHHRREKRNPENDVQLCFCRHEPRGGPDTGL